MKYLIKSLSVFMLLIGFVTVLSAQTIKNEKQAAKTAAIKQLIENQHYVFEANYVIPQTGESKQLTSEYDLRVSKDSVISFLPYFGRVYIAPIDVYPTDGGIKFSWTGFSYNVKEKNKKGWDITIKPKGKNITSERDVQYITLSVTTSGYATLQVISTNRDPISFNGTIEEISKK